MLACFPLLSGSLLLKLHQRSKLTRLCLGHGNHFPILGTKPSNFLELGPWTECCISGKSFFFFSTVAAESQPPLENIILGPRNTGEGPVNCSYFTLSFLENLCCWGSKLPVVGVSNRNSLEIKSCGFIYNWKGQYRLKDKFSSYP